MLPGHLDDGVCGNNLAAVLPSAEGTALFYRDRKFTVGLAEGHLFGFHGGAVGTGAAVIEAAIDGEAVPYAFLLKMLFTALTLGAGFKGGEIVPIFFTGATFGCVAAPLLGLPPQLGAALGMVALFCGCTNSPLASICLAIEVFGGQCVSLFALACAVSYMLSSYFSLYREQHFLHSKLRIVGVQRVHGHWSETDAAHLTTNDDGEN